MFFFLFQTTYNSKESRFLLFCLHKAKNLENSEGNGQKKLNNVELCRKHCIQSRRTSGMWSFCFCACIFFRTPCPQRNNALSVNRASTTDLFPKCYRWVPLNPNTDKLKSWSNQSSGNHISHVLNCTLNYLKFT